MRLQRPDLMINMNLKKNHYLNCSILVLTLSLLLIGCNNDLEMINTVIQDSNHPIQTGRNIEVQYTDSSRLQLVFKAPRMKKFLTSEEEGAYYEFEEGIKVFFYDHEEKLESTFKSGYANYYEKKNLWKANDSVVARNVQTGEQLTTEELFWDQENKRIYSHVFTKITNEDGVFYGEKGFESDQDLNNYRLIGSSGSVEIEDDELQ